MTLDAAIKTLLESQLPKYPMSFSDYHDAVALAIAALKLHNLCLEFGCHMARTLLPGETQE